MKGTILYLIRHSEPFKCHRGIENILDEPIIKNKLSPLSVRGERLVLDFCMKEEFKNLDVIWSSDYVRALSTAKYFAYNNNIKVNVDYRLGERIHGFTKESENNNILLPVDYEKKQSEDENYKFLNGESRCDVVKRFDECISEIINVNKGKRICIVSHGTAITFYLMKWCEYKYLEYLKFNNEIIFDGNWDFLTTFKLLFNENNELVFIKKI